MAMPRHVSWKYRFHGKFWELAREILRGTTRVHAYKNEVIIERYCILKHQITMCTAAQEFSYVFSLNTHCEHAFNYQVVCLS